MADRDLAELRDRARQVAARLEGQMSVMSKGSPVAAMLADAHAALQHVHVLAGEVELLRALAAAQRDALLVLQEASWVLDDQPGDNKQAKDMLDEAVADALDEGAGRRWLARVHALEQFVTDVEAALGHGNAANALSLAVDAHTELKLAVRAAGEAAGQAGAGG